MGNVRVLYSDEQIAQAHDVSVRTIHRWIEEQRFAEGLDYVYRTPPKPGESGGWGRRFTEHAFPGHVAFEQPQLDGGAA